MPPVAPSAFAAPGIKVIDRTPVFISNPSGRFSLCNFQKKTIAVKFAIQVTYQKRGSSQTRVGYQSATGGIIKASVVDPHVGQISPPFQTSTAARPTVYFRFTAGEPGRTTIRINEVGRYNIAREIPVIVDKCTYRISGFGTWKIPDGFQPSLYSEFDDIAVIPTSPGKFQGSGTVFNTAVAAPRGGCSTPSIQVSNGLVGIEGLDDGRGATTFTFTYTSVTATTSVVCGVSGSNKDSAIIRQATLRVRSFQDGRYAISPHMLDAYIVVVGETRIVVQLKREPPP